ncbi:MAG TPA: FMN-binding protein [Solirubrobacteraceae bacterium]|nr:FMN-binding protein [Solirubrobacteraceae bacterium]
MGRSGAPGAVATRHFPADGARRAGRHRPRDPPAARGPATVPRRRARRPGLVATRGGRLHARESALARQSAAIDAVSGATITSASYGASLQSALDKLGFEAADGSRDSSTIPDVEERRGRFGGGPPGERFPG